MSRSQNGWPVLVASQLTWFTAAGGRFAAPDANVAYVAKYLIERFDAEVEKIHGPVLDDWSHAVRKVRDSTMTISNHASATAWDLNALLHQRGAHGTFSASGVAGVRRILASIVDAAGRQIFRWGNDYVGSPIDSMHFEIIATRVQVAQARAILEDEVTPADLNAIKAMFAGQVTAVADEVMRRLAVDRVVPNQKLHPKDPASAAFPVTGVLSNLELNQDQQTEGDKIVAAMVAEIHAVVVKP